LRTAFIQALVRHARENHRIFLLVGDLGYSVVEPFAQEFPDRFINAGVAEQNMAGMAAGLAAEGFHVFTYSIANFPTLRCLEQIRNDICYHNLAVTVVAVGCGLAYGNLGFSHHGIQDIATMRCMPHLTLASPADPGETIACVDKLLRYPGPSYLRLGKAGEPNLHARPFNGWGPIEIIKGDCPLAIVATGSILSVAMHAAESLGRDGISPSVFSVPFLAPAKRDDFKGIWSCRNVISIEEHVLAGGLASLLRELAPDAIRFRSLSVGLAATHEVGSQSYLRQRNGLTTHGLVEVARTLLRERESPP
jgi:transketolase